MKREEATALLREVMRSCDGLAEQGIMLMPPNADDVLSHGYQLHIKSKATTQNYPCIKQIVDEHKDLSIVNEAKRDLTIIYKPMKQ